MWPFFHRYEQNTFSGTTDSPAAPRHSQAVGRCSIKRVDVASDIAGAPLPVAPWTALHRIGFCGTWPSRHLARVAGTGCAQETRSFQVIFQIQPAASS